jgi:hypothetical protein
MLCKDFETIDVCYTDADGVRTTLVAHYEYGADADGATVLASTIYTDAAGVPVDTSAGVVSAGACPVFQPDIEWIELCDVAADGTYTEFLCRVITSFDTDGSVIDPVQTDYFEQDKVTAYAPAGTVGPCPECPPAEVKGVLTAWGA